MHVENQRDIAVAQDGEAADAVETVEDFAKGTDNGLELAHQVINDQTGSPTRVLNDNDVFPLYRMQQEGELRIAGQCGGAFGSQER